MRVWCVVFFVCVYQRLFLLFTSGCVCLPAACVCVYQRLIYICLTIVFVFNGMAVAFGELFLMCF